jgi:sulfur relay (sulfurtransferase) complex TusBCD TusD component (DsrE family)
LLGCTTSTFATGTDDSAPLFINLTSDDPHRVDMALSFGMKQLELGHPLTVFLNDKGVYVGSTVNVDTFAEQQETITTLIGKGAVVFICPVCMQHHGINDNVLLSGLRISDPVTIAEYLFKTDTRTLSW